MEKKEKGNSVIISSLMPSFVVQKTSEFYTARLRKIPNWFEKRRHSHLFIGWNPANLKRDHTSRVYIVSLQISLGSQGIWRRRLCQESCMEPFYGGSFIVVFSTFKRCAAFSLAATVNITAPLKGVNNSFSNNSASPGFRGLVLSWTGCLEPFYVFKSQATSAVKDLAAMQSSRKCYRLWNPHWHEREWILPEFLIFGWTIPLI